MMPAAVERAQALVRHARYLGAPLNQFVVSLTKPEGYEVMEWLREDSQLNRTLLDEDIEHARELDDPWFVLRNFHLFGLEIVRREDLH